MFTTTNVAATTASVGGGGGPVAAAVPPTFQLSSTPITGSSSSSSSSSTTPTTWRLNPSATTTIIKQPATVSIVNDYKTVGTATTLPLNSTGVTVPTIGNKIYMVTTTATNSSPISTIPGVTRILQAPQTVRFISSSLHTPLSTPTLTILNNKIPTVLNNPRQIITPSITSISTNSKPGICIETAVLGGLAPISIQQQNTNISLVQQSRSLTTLIPISSDNNSVTNIPQDEEIEIFINNVVCTFALGCKLNLRKIAMEASNVIYKREQSMVMMKLRNPHCTANVWSSGKVTVTGTTSDDDARRGARRIARSLQRLGFKVHLRHYRVVNCLASCSMPWPIDIVKLSRLYPESVSYEPEIHPGATVRLTEKAVLKVFTTGNLTITAPCVERLNTAVNEFYPKLYECRNQRQY
ncbi:unnamed protein product [Adineta ricciae]|uniref:TATA box-binding protein-like 1 n=1 Tax=Adineta ricciae TaxID=249248 RepID=A0A814YKK2_ADIRI|nr:unnamed protein product [Adineta ricciae]